MSKFFDDTMQGLLEAVAIEYKQKEDINNNKLVEDVLHISVDFSPNDRSLIIIIMRRKGDEMNIVNVLKDEEAVEIYNKLIGKTYSICHKCEYHECAWKSDSLKKCEYFK